MSRALVKETVLRYVRRKPVSGVSDLVRHKPACSPSEASMRLEISDEETRLLLKQQTTKTLIRLYRSASLYFAKALGRFSQDAAHTMSNGIGKKLDIYCYQLPAFLTDFSSKIAQNITTLTVYKWFAFDDNYGIILFISFFKLTLWVLIRIASTNAFQISTLINPYSCRTDKNNFLIIVKYLLLCTKPLSCTSGHLLTGPSCC